VQSLLRLQPPEARHGIILLPDRRPVSHEGGLQDNAWSPPSLSGKPRRASRPLAQPAWVAVWSMSAARRMPQRMPVSR